jgi:hypothetical protein
MKPVYKKYCTTIALIWLGCAVLFFFAYIIILLPQKNMQQEVRKDFANKERMYNYALNAVREENKIEINEQIEQLNNILGGYAVEPGKVADLTFDISKIASEKKASFFSIKSDKTRRFTELSGCKHLTENHVGISFNADFKGFAALLNALERNRPAIFIDKFLIEKPKQENLQPKVTMNLTVLVRKHQDG